MSTSRLSTLSLKNGLPKSNNIWDGTTGFFESIATITVTSNQSNVDFLNIPSTYSHLQIRGISRTDYPTGNYSSTGIRFNSDAGSNYAAHYLVGNGASASGYGWANENRIYGTFTTTTNAVSNNFSSYVIDILDYANTNKTKVVHGLSGFGYSASPNLTIFNSGMWNSTSAINRIDLISSGTYGSYTATLYGIKASA